MKTNFTPGPWVRWKGHNSVHAATDKLKNTEGSISGCRGRVCECEGDDFGDREDEGEDIARANANLCAAAPELYAALEDMVKAFDPYDPTPEQAAAFDAAYLLLKKVRGE